MSESNEDDLVLALGPVVQTLQSLNVPFYVGGSAASSYHGAVRSTMDVDLVCELTDDPTPALKASFGGPMSFRTRLRLRRQLNSLAFPATSMAMRCLTTCFGTTRRVRSRCSLSPKIHFAHCGGVRQKAPTAG